MKTFPHKKDTAEEKFLKEYFFHDCHLSPDSGCEICEQFYILKSTSKGGEKY